MNKEERLMDIRDILSSNTVKLFNEEVVPFCQARNISVDVASICAFLLENEVKNRGLELDWAAKMSENELSENESPQATNSVEPSDEGAAND